MRKILYTDPLAYRGLTTEEAAVVYDPADSKAAALEAELKMRSALEAVEGPEKSGGEDLKDRDVLNEHTATKA